MGSPKMLARLRAWRVRRQHKDAAIRRAVQDFRETRGFAPMRAHVLRLHPEETIVRVMYLTNQIPPDRAWRHIECNRRRPRARFQGRCRLGVTLALGIGG